MSAVLEVVALSKRFGGLEAVSDLSFTVEQGEIFGLIGPNGAGKSTVFNLINGVHAPDAGQIIFDGEDITGQPPFRVARRGLARAHQIVQPFANMSVLDNCAVGACFGREQLPLHEGREVVSEVVRFLDLEDRLDMRAAALTTAGKKRLELARALCARPRLLLLDEVLAGLNPAEVEHMIGIIRKIRERGISILITEHVMRAIMSLSDRVLVLNLGRKLAQGLPQAVTNDPKVIEAYLGDPNLTAEVQRKR